VYIDKVPPSPSLDYNSFFLHLLDLLQFESFSRLFLCSCEVNATLRAEHVTGVTGSTVIGPGWVGPQYLGVEKVRSNFKGIRIIVKCFASGKMMKIEKKYQFLREL
jgi:hypothetical protein